jgi:hypothetical protein
MTATLASRTWTYMQTHAGAELKLSTTAHEGGVYHLLFIGGRSVELGEGAVCALSDAVASIQKDPASVSEFFVASFT